MNPILLAVAAAFSSSALLTFVMFRITLVASGVPLPRGAVNNYRSFTGVTNLSELLIRCALRHLGSERLFVASDGRDISTPELLGLLAARMGRPNRVFRFSGALLRLLAAAARREAEYRRLVGNLRVDSQRARTVLQWAPSKSLEAGIGEMTDWFVQNTR